VACITVRMAVLAYNTAPPPEETLMAILRLPNVPLIPQPTDGVCWWASLQMLYGWSRASNRGFMKAPESDAGFKGRFERNGDWGSGDNAFLARTYDRKTPSVKLDYAGVSGVLQKNGPIWTGLVKNWSGHNHGHVVVICGAADTGVYIHDPEPMRSGTGQWLTWAQIGKAIEAEKHATIKFLTAA
jgi:hypothetical protein